MVKLYGSFTIKKWLLKLIPDGSESEHEKRPPQKGGTSPHLINFFNLKYLYLKYF
jgi:hypothetical protein